MIEVKTAGNIKQGTISFYISKNGKIAILDINETEGGSWYLSRVIVPKQFRNQGWGTALMKKLVTWADHEDKVVLLQPMPYSDDTEKSRLISWYTQFGFKPYMPIENYELYRRLPGSLYEN